MLYLLIISRLGNCNCLASQVVDAAQKASSVLNLLSNIISDHLPVGDSFDVTTSSLLMSLRKMKASDLNSSLQMDGDKIELPSFCDMQNKPYVSNSKQNLLGPLLDLNEEEKRCESRVITTQVTNKSQEIMPLFRF